MKEKKMTYSFYVSFPGRESEIPEKIKKEDEKGFFSRLGKQLIEKGVKGKVIEQ